MTTFTATGWLRMEPAERDALVEPLYAAYLIRLEELQERGLFPYNDSFKGYLNVGDDEDTAIYLCQTRHQREAEAAKLAAFMARGAVKITASDFAPGEVRRGMAVMVGEYMGGTGYREHRDVRVLVNRGSLVALPKGKRTNGYSLSRGTGTYFLSN